MVNTTTREEIKSFSVFVKPVKNPLLSEFIINLTKITQEDIDTQGKDFTTALKEFISRAGDRDTIDFYSYGRDEIILSENCGMHHMTMPFRRGRCKNVVDIFLANDVPANNYNS
jgi:inhibitor of KinA sporulation pathway (predicted exonuclease)